jgi:histone acetyltransferase (RNA polymerase elongator complex component)
VQDIHHKVRPEEVELVRRDYTANGGWETFLAYEDVKQVRPARLRSLRGGGQLEAASAPGLRTTLFSKLLWSTPLVCTHHGNDRSCGHFRLICGKLRSRSATSPKGFVRLHFEAGPFFFRCVQDILVGLLRLRRCGRNVSCPELQGRCSIVRELHVYGTAVSIHGREGDKFQHQVR